MLAQRAESVVKFLLPQGKKEGHEWCVGNINGDAGKSLKICLLGEKSGVWCDFATGDRGDLLDLWRLIRTCTLLEAFNEATRYLGITQPKFEAHRQKKFTRPSVKKIISPHSPSPVMDYLFTERKLTNKTISAFKISEQDRLIAFNYWRDNALIFVKYLCIDRTGGKKQIHAEASCEPCLFGWQALPPNTRVITLTEGEIDAMTLYQYGFPALSLPFGGGSGKKHEWIEYEFDRLAAFDEIYLCLDNDKEGQAAVAELVNRLGRHRCRIVELPHKDANECLQKGVSREEIQKCFNQACTLDPEELKNGKSYVDQVIDEFYPPIGHEIGISPPWNKAKGKILFRPDELSIWSGINGHGKSQILGHIMLQSMKQGACVCVASLEIKPKKLLMRLTRQAAGLAQPHEDYIRAIHEWYSDKLWLFDLVGTAKADRLLEVFSYACKRYGINVFVIDSFMKCGIDEEDFKTQKTFIEKICDFKNQHSCHVHIVAHPRKSSDETQMSGKLDIKGTGAISDLADNCFIVWRNKRKEELIQLKNNGITLNSEQLKKLEECDCILRCDKQRNGDWEGKIGLWFDSKSYQYLNHEKQKATQFIEFSNIINS